MLARTTEVTDAREAAGEYELKTITAYEGRTHPRKDPRKDAAKDAAKDTSIVCYDELSIIVKHKNMAVLLTIISDLMYGFLDEFLISSRCG